MTDLETRVAVVEMISVFALGIVMASASNDPDGGKARSILDFIREQVQTRYSDAKIPAKEREAALFHSDRILSMVLENLDTLQRRRR